MRRLSAIRYSSELDRRLPLCPYALLVTTLLISLRCSPFFCLSASLRCLLIRSNLGVHRRFALRFGLGCGFALRPHALLITTLLISLRC